MWKNLCEVVSWCWWRVLVAGWRVEEGWLPKAIGRWECTSERGERVDSFKVFTTFEKTQQ